MRTRHHRTTLVLSLLASVACHSGVVTAPPPAAAGDWPSYGRDALGSRYSPLAEIDTVSVKRLAVAWTYHTGETAIRTGGHRSFEATPIVVEGTMYLITPLARIIALDAETGRERWTYDAGLDRRLGFGDHASRGVSTWLDAARSAEAPCRRRIIAATVDARLLALDARTGRPCEDFGTRGVVDLRAGLRNAPGYTEEYEETSAPAIIGDRIVVGSAVADNNRTEAASGEVRAFDVRTGARLWS